MIYDYDSLCELHERNLRDAKERLSGLEVFCGCTPSFTGLDGWVFEQTVQFALRRELQVMGFVPACSEGHPVSTRGKVDLRVGRVVVEIKAGGIFDTEKEPQKYRRYKDEIERNGMRYLFVTKWETPRNRRFIEDALGPENVFVLKTPGDWLRFVCSVLQLC